MRSLRECNERSHGVIRRGVGAALGLLLVLAISSPSQAQTHTIFNNGNIQAVQNAPTRETIVTLPAPTTIVTITTYHWNNAKGATPGTISLMNDKTGDLHGPWEATGSPGQGGVPNAYWVVTPNLTLPAGDYIVIDSDPATWAQNAGSRGAGFVTVEGSGR